MDKHVTNICSTLPPPDSQCNPNSPLCLCSLKVRLMQLPPLWLTLIHSGQASKRTKFCSKISNEIPQVWSCTASLAQPSLVTSTLKDWLQDFDPALQHFHRLLFRLSLSFYTSTPLQDTSVHPRTQALCIPLTKIKSFGQRALILLYRPNPIELTALWSRTLRIFSCSKIYWTGWTLRHFNV